MTYKIMKNLSNDTSSGLKICLTQTNKAKFAVLDDFE